jgi:hypothetical protein
MMQHHGNTGQGAWPPSPSLQPVIIIEVPWIPIVLVRERCQ